jgi:hypothetical protein
MQSPPFFPRVCWRRKEGTKRNKITKTKHKEEEEEEEEEETMRSSNEKRREARSLARLQAHGLYQNKFARRSLPLR